MASLAFTTAIRKQEQLDRADAQPGVKKSAQEPKKPTGKKGKNIPSAM
ncbi:hypothetical protein [Amycolatopsis sp. NPDC102389]